MNSTVFIFIICFIFYNVSLLQSIRAQAFKLNNSIAIRNSNMCVYERSLSATEKPVAVRQKRYTLEY